MTFDINAPIERQFTRDGRKVLAIFDSGLNCEFCISAWVQGRSGPASFIKNGRSWSNSSNESANDIITRPEPLPLIVTFHNVYLLTRNRTALHYSLDVCEANRVFDDILASIKTTFDPNTGESSSETVWQKGAK